MLVALVVVEETQNKGKEFGDGETPPDGLDVAGEAGNEPGDRQEDEQLTADRDDHAVGAAANGLENGGEDDAHSGQQEAGGDDPHGDHTDVGHLGSDLRLGFGLKDGHELAGEDHEDEGADEHDDAGPDQGNLDAAVNPFFDLRTVIVSQDGDDTIGQAEDRHEDEGLELEVDGHDVQGGVALGKAGENGVHADIHDGTDGSHNRAGQTDGNNAGQVVTVDDGILAHEAQFRILLLIQSKADDGGNELTDNRGDCRTGNAHAGAAEETEDHDGIQDDVGQGTAELGDHGQHGVSGGLEHTLKVDGHEQAGAGRGNDGQVRGTHGEDAFLVGQVVGNDKAHGLTCQEETEDDEQAGTQDLNKQAVPGTAACTFRITLAQTAAQEAVDTGTHTGGQRDHEHLEGHGQGNSGQAVGIKTGNEDAVHDVVKRLDQHGEHDWNGNFRDQLCHRHGAEQLGAFVGSHNRNLSFLHTQLHIKRDVLYIQLKEKARKKGWE